tara:strand:+ start:1181 stop:1426 length:246 start_codon:yes stop_codon:yes gene_type:complete
MTWEDIVKKDILKEDTRIAMKKLGDNLQEAMFLFSKLDQTIAQEDKEMLQIEMGDMANALLEAIKARGNLDRALYRQEELQ